MNKYNNQTDIELLLTAHITLYGVEEVLITPTYITVVFYNMEMFVMHYNKQLIKFQNTTYTNYNVSKIYDTFLTKYDSINHNKTRYYPNPDTKKNLKFLLRESRIDALLCK